MVLALALFLYAAIVQATAPATAVVPPHVAAPHDPPRILGVTFWPREFASGDVVRGKVITTTNVASVEARVGAFAANLDRARPGEFSLEYRVPWVPFFMHRSYDVAVTARNADGATVVRFIPVVLK